MEKLKSIVPSTLKRMVIESTLDDLPSTCSSLLEFLLHRELFHKIIRELADPQTTLCGKNKDAALDSKQKGNECFLSGDYMKALSFYSQALRVAPMDANEKEKNLVATLYVNRASSLHKMGLLVECLRDCNRALLISPCYVKAWYRRGKTNASLGNFEDAVRDFNVAMIVELSSSGKRQIQSELESILDKYKSTSSSLDQHSGNDSCIIDEPCQIKLQCISTPTKGRGMVSLGDTPQASLVHTEEPYAAIILKHCRETHCHFCLNELPADTVPCTSCSIPLYCSQHCKVQAGGKVLRNYPKNYGIHEILPGDIEHYIVQIFSVNDSDSDVECIAEHRHECQGVHWPAVLPSEIVLAGRVLMKLIEQRRHSTDIYNLLETLELSHNYVQMLPESKLESHIYAIVLLYCLQQSHGFELPINGDSISQLVILVSQIKVNSMAITRMKFINDDGTLDQSRKFTLSGGALTSNMEQVGQWGCKDRQWFLQDEYSFKCECSGCAELNLSDLVVNAFRCVDSNCFGIVLENGVFMCEKEKIKHFQDVTKICSSEPRCQVDMLKNDDAKKFAHHAFERNDGSLHIEPGYCMNCGSHHDLESLNATVNEAGIYIRRLQEAVVSRNISTTTLSDALRSLGQLRSTLHTYNKRIAEVEDNLAQAFCLVGESQSAMEHCKASIEVKIL
ncbi:hypothetical protein L1049_011138 [Liquidambar formosana]|uniref:SET and MYND domain-containing protein 4 n=1 Tax=Liquidambar formosana TaxID=63359 RepID=A0AAP0RRR0_LIQFO